MMKRTALTLLTLLFLIGGSAGAVSAGPHLTLSPAAGTFSVGTEFQVTIGVDSGTEKSAAVDAWVNFDAAKLEVVSIEKAASPAFSFVLGQNIHNSEGKFDISCTSTDMSSFETTVIKGDLAVVTFRTKSEGVASLNFSCATGSSIDTNIFNVSAVDVIDCASNQSGSYTISAGSGGGTTPTPTPTTGATTTTTTSTSDELPQTGAVENTVGLMIFGLAAVMGALFLRWL